MKIQDITEGYGRYYCSTDKKWKTRKGPKQTRKVSESYLKENASKLLSAEDRNGVITVIVQAPDGTKRSLADANPRYINKWLMKYDLTLPRNIMSKFVESVEQGVAEGLGNIRSMIQQYEDMVELVYDLPPGRKKNIAIDKRDALEAQIEAMPGGPEALRQWAKSYNDAIDEGVAEMDKSQPSHGRDGKVSHSTYGSRDKGGSAGQERTAKMTTADKMMKDAHDAMMRSMSDADKVKKGWRNPNMNEQGVAEGISIIDQDSDLDQQVFTLNVDGNKVSFTYWDYETNFQHPDIKDIYQQAKEQLSKKLSPEQIKDVARTVFKSFEQGVAEGLAENSDQNGWYVLDTKNRKIIANDVSRERAISIAKSGGYSVWQTENGTFINSAKTVRYPGLGWIDVSETMNEQGVAEEKQRLDPKCWDGYKKDGTKMKGGVRVNNCVKEDSLEEYGDTAQGQKMLTKVQKRAVDRVVSKKADTDPKYAKKNSDTAKRAWDRMTDLEETYDGDEFFEAYGELWYNEDEQLDEAEYQGRSVPLGKPMQGDVKKFKVYVKDPSTGNVKKVNFGDPDMKIRKSNPAARRSFRARHNCDNPGPRTKARYWSCRKW